LTGCVAECKFSRSLYHFAAVLGEACRVLSNAIRPVTSLECEILSSDESSSYFRRYNSIKVKSIV